MTALVSNSPSTKPLETLILGKEAFTGCLPACINSIGREKGKIEGPVIATFKILGALEKTEVLAEMAKTKRLVWLNYENGSMKSVGMHSKLLNLMDQEKVTDIGLSGTHNKDFCLVEDAFYFLNLNDEIYSSLASKLKV